ncbi:hypothetical protein BKA57DRAFT_458580 [Linnemannia elongata]|uniref:FAD/NAD(P)-binding domain-containing protein n=1 Tax=Linnemannia elongata AG-77 TaxID=1314771 RepID=A0A197JW18_9FUNG|nr:hypothetical protein BKA57DRAFT_458580 [Linnemannia elongata]OAQ28626.1 FAD/NAD(P)-binding domain-containing protein [Linnemannia elongata AG-77]
MAEGKPTVMIIGAGLGGLTMAILLERAGVDYHVYEKYKEPRPLGSATGINPNILPLFEQLGLLEKLKAVAKEVASVNVYTADMEQLGSIDVRDHAQLSGYLSLIMSRRDLHAFLLSEVPQEKMTLGTKVLSIQQNQYGVMIRTNDGKHHHADILIGSDGAYSAVRQSLYKQMSTQGILPKSDGEALKVCHMGILGTTERLDPEKFPRAHETYGHSGVVIGDKTRHTWRYFSVPGGRVCWRIDVQLKSTSHDESDAFRLSEWDADSFKLDADDWREFKTDLGGTMGDLIDATPKECISKVMLEEKLFETWYHNRTVLIGDSCHKMLPNAGRGALNAMMDAVVLANTIYEITSATPENITAALKEYYEIRYPHAKLELQGSQRMAKVLAGQTWLDSLTRSIVLGYLPKSIQQKNTENGLRYRPQLTFLPQVEARGTVPPLPQMVSKRFLAEQQQQQEQEQALQASAV